MTSPSWARACVVALSVSIGTPASPATTRSWNNSSGGSYSTSTNWSGGVVPGAADKANFSLGGLYNVTFTSNVVNSQFAIVNDDVTLAMAGRTYSVTAAADSLVVGGAIGHSFGVGKLTLSSASAGAALGSVNAAIGGTGAANVGSGRVTVNGNVTWNNSGLMVVGNGVAGTLIVQGGADVNNAIAQIGLDATGTATVSGSGSTWINSSTLDVGGNANGTLNVSSGGLVRDTDGTLGGAASSTGSAVISGANSRWENSHVLTVGLFGHGNLSVADNGVVTANATGSQNVIADLTGSTGIVTLDTGGQLSLGGFLNFYIGKQGAGTLNINAGGKAANGGQTYIAQHPFGSGSVTIGGANALWTNNGAVFVGGGAAAAGGPATLSVSNGGKLAINAANTLKIWPSGTVNLAAGGTIETGGLQNAGGAFNWSAGTLHYLIPVAVGPGGPLGATLTLNGGRILLAPQISVGLTGVGALNIGAQSSAASDGDVNVGAGGAGTIAVDGGGTLASYGALLGVNAGGNGLIALDGAGSHWELPFVGFAPELVTLGRSGTGTLQLTAGARVHNEYADVMMGENDGGRGILVVNGAGSQFDTSFRPITVGNAGDGEIEVQNGGLLLASAVLGALTGGYGSAAVSGVPSTWDAPDLVLGDEGVGELTIASGGIVHSSQPEIGSDVGGSGAATVSDPGSLWDSDLDFIVGKVGSGVVVVQNGGALSQDNTVLGAAATGAGMLTVTGAGSHVTSEQQVSVGFDGVGTLNVEQGAVLDCQKAIVGKRAGSSGDARVSGAGSQWNIAQTLDIGGGTRGKLIISNAAEVAAAGNLSVYVNGTLDLDGGTVTAQSLELNAGALVGDGIAAALVTNAGVISPGHSAGELSIAGNYVQLADGALHCELGGVAKGVEFDALDVSGTATLGGTLDVSLIDGFEPGRGLTFEILHASSVAGQFATVHQPVGIVFDVLYSPNSVRLHVISSPHCAGCDANCDGSVNQFDIEPFIAAVLVHSGCSACAGDTNSDGTTNQFDINGFLACLGAP